MLLHIPHSSLAIPSTVRKDLHISDDALALELLRTTDWFTDEIFELEDFNVPRVVYPFSRLVCDVERFADDAREPQSVVGLGAIYLRTSDGSHLRDKMDAVAHLEYLRRYYDPHQRELLDMTESILVRQQRCLIIDCHSFSTIALPSDQDQSPNRPDVCIGTNCVHTPPALVSLIENYCEGHGLNCAVNRPYAGTMVPQKYFMNDKRVMSVMIEIRRGLYVDEDSGTKLDDFESIHELVHKLLLNLLDKSQSGNWVDKWMASAH